MTEVLIAVFIFVTALAVGSLSARKAWLNGLDDIDGQLLRTVERDAFEQLEYLEKSKCNLFYNPQINSWGLVDGKDKLISAGESIRDTIRRAQDKDLAARVAEDFKTAESAN